MLPAEYYGERDDDDEPLKTRPEQGCPEAMIFSNGNAVYFDECGNQIPLLQAEGPSALAKFMALYPYAKVNRQ